MTGDLLLSFFLAMPAVVVLLKSREMSNPTARALLSWGGALACILALMVVGPMLACDGHLMKSYSNCILGGDALAARLTQAQPALILAGKIYILVGIPLGVFAFFLNNLTAKKAQ